MTLPSSQNVLRLYKHLLKYGKQLQLTDKDYFAKRIQNEFKNNKNLSTREDILFHFKRGEAVLKNGKIV